jgi:peptidyl-prolyl cis-trans isomerase B (cyclophilin B)
MSPSRRRGRRVPPRTRGTGPAMPPGATSPSSDSTARPPDATARPTGSMASAGNDVPLTLIADSRVRPASRSSNRAAKRMASGRPPSGAQRPAKRPSSTGPLLALGAVAVAVVVGVIAFGNPFGGGAAASASPGASAVVHGDGTCPTSQPEPLPAGESRLVTITTDLGDIVIRVDGALSPIAAGNFVALAECAFYDGVAFHRTAALEDGTPFVIQGGDPDGTGRGGPGYTIKDEPVTATYHRGTVAMARSQGIDTQGSQFFIVLDDGAEPALKSANTYAIFGEVISGMDVADAIFQASDGQENPADPVVMDSVVVSNVPPPSGSPGPSSGSAVPSGSSPAPSPSAQ